MKKDGSEGGWVLEWDKDQEISNKESGKTPERRTFRLIREEANRIVPGLEFTTDLPSDNKDGRFPMLDLKLWAE